MSGTGWVWSVPDVLGKEREAELAEMAHNGDAGAAAALVAGNVKLILHMASAMGRTQADREDLVGEGMLGAWIAASRYDPACGVRFCTYATWWIRSLMAEYRRKSRRLMTDFPRTHRAKRELGREYAETGKTHLDEKTRSAVCERIGVSPKYMQELIDAMGSYKVCLEAPAFDGGPPLMDFIASSFPDPYEEYAAKEERDGAKRRVALAMSALSSREAWVVRATADGTFESAGRALGVTKQRAKQISDKAMRKMRARLKSEERI